VLLANQLLRDRVTVGLTASLVAIAAWYAPHVNDLLDSSKQEFGSPIPWYGLITSPVEQVLAPALLWIEGPALTTDLTRLPIVAVLALVIVSSPLLREPRTGMVIGSGLALTLLVVWAAQIYLSPRFVSYLLVPLFVLAASGAAALLTHRGARAWFRAGLALTMLGLAVLSFASEAPPVLRLPREAHKDAIGVVRDRASETPVLAYTYHPSDLEYYLGRRVERLKSSDVSTHVCESSRPVFYVTQPFNIRPVVLPCARRQGVELTKVRQYTRGDEIAVRFMPPAASRERD
jgi:hypothetical protein